MSRNPMNPCPSWTKENGVMLACELERDHDGEHTCDDTSWTEPTL